jgi:hypothetical protein
MPIKLLELLMSTHYEDRKAERTTIHKLSVPKIINDEYGFEKVNQTLIKYISTQINRKLSPLEDGTGNSKSDDYKVIPIYSPILKFRGEEHNIQLHTTSSKGDEKVPNKGNLYVIIVAGNVMVTIYLANKNEDLFVKARDHLKRIGKSIDNIKIVGGSDSYTDIIDIDKLINGENLEFKDSGVDKGDLDYKVRTDYRAGASLQHKKYGNVKIINTSNGKSGQPNSSGMLKWVEIKVKPYLKGGKVLDTRKITNIYANAYWLDKK